MSMSKKDFIALADVMGLNPDEFSDRSLAILADFCASQNPAFNRDRWLAYINGECGPSGGSVKKAKGE